MVGFKIKILVEAGLSFFLISLIFCVQLVSYKLYILLIHVCDQILIV